MANLPLVPVELYLHSSYEPDAEFVDGEVELRPMGEFDHASWQQALQLWFVQNDHLTRRATIWIRSERGWQILYHQGTILTGAPDDSDPGGTGYVPLTAAGLL